MPSHALNEEQAMEIATGAPIPRGADAVIRVEDTKVENNRVKIFQSIPPQRNIIQEGEDVTLGSVILHKGEEIRPDHLGLLRSLGIQKLKLARQPRVGILATGDELVPPGKPLPPGKIYDSNNLMNSTLLSRYGGIIVYQKLLPDDPALIRQEILAGSNSMDFVVCSGGTSVGKKDFLPQVLKELGEIVVHGVAQKPGSPILLGKVNEKPVICLPGFPVANYISNVTIVGPFLRYLQGALKKDPRPVVFGEIKKNVSVKGLGRINYLRVNLQETNTGYVVIPKKLSGSGILRSLVESDGLVEIPANVEGLEEGEIVKVFLHIR
ncbi:MAG: Molybdopterin biosynthesis MoeA protein [Promethearchaeota archaeon CR_4]|nr:MAG: Molybdopterin biosynthesis MoeA protein [Candidatus Lokiarchaeota archaeon CR_4]